MATDGAAPTASDPGSKQKLLTFDTKEDLAVSLAKYTADLSKKFAAERGAFTVVLSGGSLIDALRLFDVSPTPHKSRLLLVPQASGSGIT
jgi:6-phosphogluconolactonase